MTTAARAGQDQVVVACGGCSLVSCRARSRSATPSRRTANALAGGREARDLGSSGGRGGGVATGPAASPQRVLRPERPRPRPSSPSWPRESGSRTRGGPLAILRLARAETYSAQQCTVLPLALLAAAPGSAAKPRPTPATASADAGDEA